MASQGSSTSASAVTDTVCGALVTMRGFSPGVQNLEAGGPAAAKSFAPLWWKLLEGGPADVRKAVELRVGWAGGGSRAWAEAGDVVRGRGHSGGAGGPKSKWLTLWEWILL